MHVVKLPYKERRHKMDNFIFSLNAVAPIFIVILFGTFLKKKGIINSDYINISTNVVFKIALPAMIFRDISKTDFTDVFNIKLILYSVFGTLAIFLLLCLFGSLFIKNKKSLGAFIQGGFRGNFAFLGLPLIYNLFGQEASSKGAIVLSFIMPLYNVLAIIILTATSSESSKYNIKGIIINILKNPLIIAVVCALPFSFFNITLPQLAVKSIEYVADIATPLALIGIGATIDLNNLKKSFKLSIVASGIKVIFGPLIAILLAYLIGFRESELGIIFVLFSSPTAIASFIMAKAMGSDSELASSIVVTTTLMSVFTIFAGIFALKTLGLI